MKIGLIANNNENIGNFYSILLKELENIDFSPIVIDKNFSFCDIFSVDIIFVILNGNNNIKEFIIFEIFKTFRTIPSVLVVDNYNSILRHKNIGVFDGFLDYWSATDQIKDVIDLTIKGYKVFPKKIKLYEVLNKNGESYLENPNWI